MKKILSFILFTICSNYLFAQTQSDQKVDSVKYKNFVQQDWVKDLLKRQQQSYKANDTARYIHRCLGGGIYTLPQDRMPCLRPDTSMYVYNQAKTIRQPFVFKNDKLIPPSAPENQMPNAIPVKPLVWEKKP